MAKQKPKSAEDNDPYADLSREDRAALKAALGERKEKALADRLAVQNAITCGELVPRSLSSSVFGDHFFVHRGQFLSLPSYCGSLIAAVYGNSKLEIKMDEIMTDMCYGVLRKIKKDMEKWLNKIPISP